ncbi:hypothetical protein F5B18DRAFT_389056 [Nemania serpens]|nr:hypothetical protein F5B18DRAFT_389056 [Nemania serpens]
MTPQAYSVVKDEGRGKSTQYPSRSFTDSSIQAPRHIEIWERNASKQSGNESGFLGVATYLRYFAIPQGCMMIIMTYWLRQANGTMRCLKQQVYSDRDIPILGIPLFALTPYFLPASEGRYLSFYLLM